MIDGFQQSENTWSEALLCETKEDFLAFMKTNHPKDFIIYHEKLEYFVNKHYPEPEPEYVPNYTTDQFNVPPVVQNWVDEMVIYLYLYKLGIARPARPKSLVIIGPSRTGKTSWARSLGPHIYFNGYFNGRGLLGRTKSVGYAVFDDTKLERIINPKGWFGAQETFTITDKYVRKTDITWGRPSIFLINPDMDYRNHELWDYISLNSIVYIMDIDEKFY